MRMISKGFFVFVFALSLLACQAGSDNGSGVSVSQLKTELQAANTEMAKLKEELAQAHKLIEELKQTPEQLYKKLVDQAEKVASVDESTKLLTQTNAFIKKNPQHPLARSAKKLVVDLNAKQKVLQKKEDEIAAEKAIETLKKQLASVKDGNDLASLPLLALAKSIKAEFSMDVLKKLPSTNKKEAMKDADAVRGKVLSARGRVIQISKQAITNDLTVYEGNLMENWDVFHFIAVGSTEGVYQDSYAKFVGVFSQLYSYPNVGGGTTNSIVLVGYFDIKQNRTK